MNNFKKAFNKGNVIGLDYGRTCLSSLEISLCSGAWTQEELVSIVKGMKESITELQSKLEEV